MFSIKPISSKLLILITGFLAMGTAAQADQEPTIRDTQPSSVASDTLVKTSDKLASKSTIGVAAPTITKDATEEGLIRKTEPLPQFYFPY